MTSHDARSADFQYASPSTSSGSSGVSTSPLLANSQPSARYNEEDSQSSSPEERSVNTSSKRFINVLFDILKDDNMMIYIRWYKEGELDGISIPDIQAFADNAMPLYFPDMKKWESFQKQLNNYGFKKRNRGPNEGLYFHRNNMFRKDRRDLLLHLRCKTNRRVNASTRQCAVEQQPPPPTAPRAIGTTSQPSNKPDLQALVIQLQKENRELTQTVQDLKESTERELAQMRAQLSAMADGMPVERGSFSSTGHVRRNTTGDNRFGMSGVRNSIGVGNGPAPAPSTGTYFDGYVQGPFYDAYGITFGTASSM